MQKRKSVDVWSVLAILLMGSMSTDLSAEEKSFVKLTRGIVGGIVPPFVKGEILILAENGTYQIHVMKHKQRTAKKQFQIGTLSKKEYEKLFALLKKKGFWNLPREQPAGSEDIYKMDTAISSRIGKNYWKNGGPGGCIHGVSKIQASKKQQEEFRELIEKIESLANEKLKDSDSRKYKKAFDAIAKRVPKS